MSDARSMEDAIAHLCITTWGETPQNHVCGLIEETMEAVAETGQLTEEQAIAVATAAVKRAFASVAESKAPGHLARVNSELEDVCVMAAVVRATCGQQNYESNTAFHQGGFAKIMKHAAANQDPTVVERTKAKLRLKKEQGVRL
jgi:hypothetical protein